MNQDLAEKAKNELIRVVGEVNLMLTKYWEGELLKNFGYGGKQQKLVKELLFHAKDHNLRKAKRIRAALTYWAYLLNEKENVELGKVMVAMELIQTALLMHDDFMDQDLLRRGQETTNAFFGKTDRHYGESMAVNLGDVVLCLGYERLLEVKMDTVKVNEATKILMRGIVNTAFGQALDMSLPKMGKVSEEDVLNLHKSKTALYTFKNPLVVGGILGGVDKKVLEILEKYAELAGIAFQLQDDILGVFGDEELTGKSINSDIKQGKNTLLYVKALENANEKQRKVLTEVWGKENAGEEEIKAVREIIVETGSLAYSKVRSVKIMGEAIKEIGKLREMNVNQEAVDFFEGIALYLKNREV